MRPFGGGQRLGQVLFDEFAGETGPSGEETGVNSFDPGRWDGAAGSLMQILHNVLLATWRWRRHSIGTRCWSRQNGGGRLEWDVPKASAGIISAGEDDLETVENLHFVGAW